MNNYFQEIADAVGRKLGEEFEVKMEEIAKQNDKILHGIIIKETNEDMAAVHYVEYVINEFGEKSADFIADKIIKVHNDAVAKPGFDLATMFSKMLAFENVNEHVVYSLLNAEMNKERLKNAVVIHLENTDYAYVPVIRIPDENGGVYQAMITNNIVEKEGYDMELLHKHAIANTMAKYPPMFVPLTKDINDVDENTILDPRDENFTLDNCDDMFALTAENNDTDGAVALFYPDMKKRIAEVLGQSYYVIPVDINNVLIVPESRATADQLNKMLHEGNKFIVPPDEQLGNEVLRYDINTGMLSGTIEN